ncbi:MAG: hypothetical protein J0H10_16930 [Alphaproteobacteria bacterium]|nr:hypothetical protein [Alphaproteobacteria bacterium]
MTEAQNEWARCRPWIEAALPSTRGTHTIQDIEEGIAEGRFQFWPGKKSAIVTEIVVYPQYKALNFFLVGGDLSELINEMEPAITRWAKHAYGCKCVALIGRKGWARALRSKGYEEVMTVTVKDL